MDAFLAAARTTWNSETRTARSVGSAGDLEVSEFSLGNDAAVLQVEYQVKFVGHIAMHRIEH
jgi:hypothetical protein